MNLIICPGCGAEVPENMKKCIVCGCEIPDLKKEFSKVKPMGSLLDGFWTGFLLEIFLGFVFTLSAKYVSGPLYLIVDFVGILALLMGPFVLSGGGSKQVIGYLLGGVLGLGIGFWVLPILMTGSPNSIFNYWSQKLKP